jgi:hypothetical protein
VRRKESEEQGGAETIKRGRGNAERERKCLEATVSRTTVNDERIGAERQEQLCRDFAERALHDKAFPIVRRTVESSPEVIMATWPPIMVVGGRRVRRELLRLFVGMFWWREQASRMGVTARVFHGEAG